MGDVGEEGERVREEVRVMLSVRVDVEVESLLEVCVIRQKR